MRMKRNYYQIAPIAMVVIATIKFVLSLCDVYPEIQKILDWVYDCLLLITLCIILYFSKKNRS